MSLRGQLGVWRVPFARYSSPFIPWLLQVKKSAKKLQPQSTEPARRPSQKEKRGRSEEKPRARSGLMLPSPMASRGPHNSGEGPGVQSQSWRLKQLKYLRTPSGCAGAFPWATLSLGHQAVSGTPVVVTLGCSWHLMGGGQRGCSYPTTPRSACRG